jgi:hypothetical protein
MLIVFAINILVKYRNATVVDTSNKQIVKIALMSYRCHSGTLVIGIYNLEVLLVILRGIVVLQ